MTSDYRIVRAPVRGGEMTVGVWGPEDGPTILAVHGITASHMSWALVAEALPDVRIIAPDLRGRGRSNSLPGPWGMPSHAEDMAAVLDHFGLGRVPAVGHSMGGFVVASLARFFAERVSSLVLIDGGLPIPLPAGLPSEDIPAFLIGPAAERLSMTFASVDDYRAFWRDHPAFADDWNDAVQNYIDYDLDGVAPNLTPSGVYEAVAQDSLQLNGDTGYADALLAIRVPVTFVHAERGLLNQVPPLYPDAVIDEWNERMQGLDIAPAPGVNHYTITLSRRGAELVTAPVRAAIAGVRLSSVATDSVATETEKA